MYSDLQGNAGKSLQQFEGLEFTDEDLRSTVDT